MINKETVWRVFTNKKADSLRIGNATLLSNSQQPITTAWIQNINDRQQLQRWISEGPSFFLQHVSLFFCPSYLHGKTCLISEEFDVLHEDYSLLWTPEGKPAEPGTGWAGHGRLHKRDSVTIILTSGFFQESSSPGTLIIPFVPFQISNNRYGTQ
jgi:hypothetical protein